MFNKYSFLLILILLVSCSTKTKVLDANETPFKLGVCINEKHIENVFNSRDNSIIEVKVLYQGQIDKNNDLVMEKDAVIKQINKLYPKYNQKGICMLDWEDPILATLQLNQASSKEFIKARNAYIDLIHLVRSLRPNIKLAVYGLPFREYYGRTEKWYNASDNIIPIIKECDIIMPSIYDFHKGHSSGNHEYVNDNVANALRLGKKLNKPVYPVVWHRYHVSNKTVPNHLIPKEEFTGHVRSAINSRYEGEKIKGIVWWGLASDEYFYSHKKLKPIVQEVNNRDIKSYQEKLLKEYGVLILRELHSIPNL